MNVFSATVMNDTLSAGGGVTITTNTIPSSNEEAMRTGKDSDLFISENSIWSSK